LLHPHYLKILKPLFSSLPAQQKNKLVSLPFSG
jgi:hypothetical protein